MNLCCRFGKFLIITLAALGPVCTFRDLGQLELVKEWASSAFLSTGKAPYANAIIKAIEMERKVLGLDREAKADDGKVTAEDLLQELARELDD